MINVILSILAVCLIVLSAAGADNVTSYWTEQAGIQPNAANPGASFVGTLKDPEKLKGHGSSDMPVWGNAAGASNAVQGHGSSDMPVWGDAFKKDVKVRAKFSGKGIWTITDVKANKSVKVKLKVPGFK